MGAKRRAQSHEEVLGGRLAATTSFTVNRSGKQQEEKLTGKNKTSSFISDMLFIHKDMIGFMYLFLTMSLNSTTSFIGFYHLSLDDNYKRKNQIIPTGTSKKK